MKQRITEEEAFSQMTQVGLKPLEPYPGLHKPWRAECINCNRQVAPHFTSIRHRQSGCAYCSGRRVDPIEAIKLMEDAGYKPLEPFKGTSRNWKCECKNCGTIVTPRYTNIKQGWGGCKKCAKLLVDPSDAMQLFERNNLKPLSSYPGSHKPWPSICLNCNRVVKPRFSDVKIGKSKGCKFCSGNSVDEKDARTFMESKGFSSNLPFPGANRRWKGICKKCLNEITPIYSAVKFGQGVCKYCARKGISERDALALLKKSSLKPLERYTKAGNKILCLCLRCKKEVRVRIYGLIQGESGCAFCAGVRVDPNDAERLMRKAGFIPQENFPGAKARWLCLCEKCKKLVKPAYSNVLQGSRCIYCNRDSGSWNSDEPGFLYLIENKVLNSFKVGITHSLNHKKGRLAEHIRNGWQLLNSFAFQKGIDAFEVEQEILDFFKEEGLEPFLRSEDLPQGGWTETVDASEIDAETIWKKVLELSRMRR